MGKGVYIVTNCQKGISRKKPALEEDSDWEKPFRDSCREYLEGIWEIPVIRCL